MSIDYTILYKERLAVADLAAATAQWRVFISAFNASERVQTVFATVKAGSRHWIIHPEYGYLPEQLPRTANVFASPARNEADFIEAYLRWATPSPLDEGLCVDITGFMRPQLMFLLKRLFDAGVPRFDVLYTDPERYAKEEKTTFTKGPVVEVRQVAGYEGQHIPDARTRDLLIIGTGYDHELIRRLAEAKEDAWKVQMFGLPSLQPDMYQENVLRAMRAAEAVGASSDSESCFAPANDPFVTAQVLHERIASEREARGVKNVYLSPVGTKVQVLGFSLYFLTELAGQAASMIFPFAESYEQETTKGIRRIWRYTVERLLT